MSAEDIDCRICGAAELVEFPEFAKLRRVTSDCRSFPAGGRLAICASCGVAQKPDDARWRREAQSIYAAYDPCFQSGGLEQAVFDPTVGVPHKRSDALLQRLNAAYPPATEGTMLDVGCGNGAMIAAFARFRPGWRLSGYDVGTLHAETLANIPGFETLHTGPLDTLPGGYDLITVIHALEHIPDPVAGLASLGRKLGMGACLLVEVPDCDETPFDLLVADHATHFTAPDMALVLRRAGLAAKVIATDWLTKEISVVAAADGPPVDYHAVPNFKPAHRRVQAHLDWIAALASEATDAARHATSFGLFGTSVASMWLFAQLKDNVSFFVDEDPARAGTELFGRPVLAPRDVPEGSVTFLALIPHVAHAVAARLARTEVDFRCPPELQRWPNDMFETYGTPSIA